MVVFNLYQQFSRKFILKSKAFLPMTPPCFEKRLSSPIKFEFQTRFLKSHHLDVIVNGIPVKMALTQNILECFLILNMNLINILKGGFVETNKSISLIP